jgi:hypothetical protein
MKIVDGKFQMKGGVRDTLFGVIGVTKGYSNVKSLGGLVVDKADGKVPTGLKKERVGDATERSIGGKNATKIPGVHMGMVPYPGMYMKAVGAKL